MACFRAKFTFITIFFLSNGLNWYNLCIMTFIFVKFINVSQTVRRLIYSFVYMLCNDVSRS